MDEKCKLFVNNQKTQPNNCANMSLKNFEIKRIKKTDRFSGKRRKAEMRKRTERKEPKERIDKE